jgi:histidyl-tRNA synthetase
MKKIKFQRPTGMHDILSFDQRYFKKISNLVDEISDFYGFNKIDTPILEQEDLFHKGIGDQTDITQKEIYSLKTKGGDRLALRPEGTAPIVRAYIEHGMFTKPQPIKLYYIGPFFRHEKPQAGRYRQFWQFGFENLGDSSPVADAQMIQMAYSLFSEIGLKDISIEINSIGDKDCRPAYRRALIRYLKSKQSQLCPECKKRLKDNPLRVLDCKDERCQEVRKEAPQTLSYLCPECHSHFKKTLEYLDELELPYNLNPYLVRGLDYYNKTVFEFFKSDIDKKSLALGGGGRYDGLVKLLGGKDIPGVGAAFGIERIIQTMKDVDITEIKKNNKRVFLAQLGEVGKRKSLKLMEEFRKSKINVSEMLGKDSLKIQMSKASRVGARFTVIVGQKEAIENKAIIRDMETGTQDTVDIKSVVSEVKKRISKK